MARMDGEEYSNHSRSLSPSVGIRAGGAAVVQADGSGVGVSFGKERGTGSVFLDASLKMCEV